MKINALSTYQFTDEIADIVLSVDFKKVEIKEYDLTSTTVWMSYDFNGNFLQYDIADEGFPVNLKLTEEELEQVMNYIDDNNLKVELLRQLKDRVSKTNK